MRRASLGLKQGGTHRLSSLDSVSTPSPARASGIGAARSVPASTPPWAGSLVGAAAACCATAWSIPSDPLPELQPAVPWASRPNPARAPGADHCPVTCKAHEARQTPSQNPPQTRAGLVARLADKNWLGSVVGGPSNKMASSDGCDVGFRACGAGAGRLPGGESLEACFNRCDGLGCVRWLLLPNHHRLPDQTPGPRCSPTRPQGPRVQPSQRSMKK